MRFFETGGKSLITFAVLGIVALLIVGALSTGPDSWTFTLENVNTTSTAVAVVAGTVLPILFFIAIVLKLI